MLENLSPELTGAAFEAVKFAAISGGSSYLLNRGNLSARAKLLDNPALNKIVQDQTSFETVDPFKIGTVNIQAIGANHLPEVFIDHQAEFREKVSGSHFVVLEYFRESARQRAIPGAGNHALIKRGQTYQER